MMVLKFELTSFFVLFEQLVANHEERIRQEETCPQKVMNHVRELAEQLFKNVRSLMVSTQSCDVLLLCFFS